MKTRAYRPRRHVFYYPRPLLSAGRGLGWSYAERNGAPCLRGETSWTKINGFYLNTSKFNLWLLFRRA